MSNIKIKGLKKVVNKLNNMPINLRKKVLRKAVNKAATPVLKSARKKAPKRTGLLRKALTKKVKRYGGTFLAIIGVREGLREQIGQKRDGSPIWADPSKYHHLVHLGTKQGIQANPYLKDALKQNSNKVINDISNKVTDEVQKEWRKK